MSRDHPLRSRLTEEMHARRLGHVQAPCEVTQLLTVFTEGGQQAVRQHALKIAGRDMETSTNLNHLTASINGFEFTWECHTEFSTYTFAQENAENLTVGTAFKSMPLQYIPQEWLLSLQGKVMVAAHVVLDKAAGLDGDDAIPNMRNIFEGQVLVEIGRAHV